MEQPQLPENRRTLYAVSARFDRKERKLFWAQSVASEPKFV